MYIYIYKHLIALHENKNEGILIHPFLGFTFALTE